MSFGIPYTRVGFIKYLQHMKNSNASRRFDQTLSKTERRKAEILFRRASQDIPILVARLREEGET